MQAHDANDGHGVEQSYSLPTTLQGWRKPNNSGDWWKPWEYCRSFFKSCGYELYERDKYPNNVHQLIPLGTVTDRRPNSFGVYGTRSYVPVFEGWVRGPIWPAVSRDGQDVMLKVISYKNEGVGEVEILEYLLSERVKSEVDNPVVPLLEILHHQDWKFSVQARWSECVEPEFRTVSESLDFCAQVTKGVAFLHRHLIAHLDIAQENILMNFLGIEQTDIQAAKYLKTRFPIRYGFIDFGHSRRFEPNTTPHLADVYSGRFHKAPELDLEEPYNPFAADVYQTGSMLLILFYNIILLIPEFGSLVNDMMRQDSNQRISIAEAHQRFQTLRDKFFRTPRGSQTIDTKWLCIFTRAPETEEELDVLRKKMEENNKVLIHRH